MTGASPATPPGTFGLWPRVRHDRLFFGLIAGLVVLAWLSLWLWQQSPHARFLGHEEIGGTGPIDDGYLVLLALFVGGWTLMTIAMMLPTSLPVVAFFRTLVRRRSNHVSLVALLVLGYVGVWIAFAGLVHVGDLGIHEAVERVGWLHQNAWVIAASTFAFAGVYQFSTMKYRCLDKCRSPVAFVMQNWRGQEHWDALRLGVRHGIFCLGCCWALMLVMFAAGVASLLWMALLTGVMIHEKTRPAGARAVPVTGVALLAAASVVLAYSAAAAAA